MNQQELGKRIGEITNWDKPGGGLAKVVAVVIGIAVVVGFFNILPFLLAAATNLLYLVLECAALAGILFLATNKQFKAFIGAGYFILMRKLAGLLVELDPIAIVRMKIAKMNSKLEEIGQTIGRIRGLIDTSEKGINSKKRELKDNLDQVQYWKEQNKLEKAQVAKNQANRLEEFIKNKLQRLKDSKKWYEILCKLEEMTKLTVIDTENEVAIREEEFKEIKEQHKAYKSVMSIIKGDPDDMAMFQAAMDFMANDISAKLGEMEHVLNSAGGLIDQYEADKAISSKQANELLERYDKFGIDGMFESFNDKQSNNQISYISNITISEPEKTSKENKYFN